jgi:hypothetical protein
MATTFASFFDFLARTAPEYLDALRQPAPPTGWAGTQRCAVEEDGPPPRRRRLSRKQLQRLAELLVKERKDALRDYLQDGDQHGWFWQDRYKANTGQDLAPVTLGHYRRWLNYLEGLPRGAVRCLPPDPNLDVVAHLRAGLPSPDLDLRALIDAMAPVLWWIMSGDFVFNDGRVRRVEIEEQIEQREQPAPDEKTEHLALTEEAMQAEGSPEEPKPAAEPALVHTREEAEKAYIKRLGEERKSGHLSTRREDYNWGQTLRPYRATYKDIKEFRYNHRTEKEQRQ